MVNLTNGYNLNIIKYFKVLKCCMVDLTSVYYFNVTMYFKVLECCMVGLTIYTILLRQCILLLYGGSYMTITSWSNVTKIQV